MTLVPLPIDSLLDDIVAKTMGSKSLVLEAPPGSGKTTRVPQAFLNAPFLKGKEILILEPRRLAAKLAARRVAYELDSEVGELVGYHFRFENVGGPHTRIRFLTEGMFLRRILSDPTLRTTGLVIVDEFHERHLQGDLALALVKRLQAGPRPDLALVVMSATLDGAKVAQYLNSPHVKAEGRRFPVDIEYLGDDRDAYLDDKVKRAVDSLITKGHKGDMLVFLPGVGEIRRAQEALSRKFGSDLRIAPLYADLSKEEQDLAVRPGDKQKVVLATNVAETSLTIEGVTAVIDSGLARIPSHNAWSGLPVLRLQKISRASATQRTGRAGRTAPGICLRLYGQSDFAGRPEFEIPEVRRLDLAPALLELKAMGLSKPGDFPWYEAPPATALEAGTALLYRLGAADSEGVLTPLGKQMATLPVHPRLARLMVEAARRGISDDGCLLSAWLSERPDDDPDNEVAGLLESIGARGARIQGIGMVDRARKQYRQAVERAVEHPKSKNKDDAATALRKSVLAAYPDQVGRVRSVAKNLSRNRSGEAVEVVLCGGGSARLMNPHLPGDTEFVVALDAEERTQGGLKGEVKLRLVGAIEADWLLELEPSAVEETVEAVWHERLERAEVRSRLMYEKLVITESPAHTPEPSEQAAAEELLARKGVEAGVGSFLEVPEWEAWLGRVNFARSHADPELFPAIDAAWAIRMWSKGETGFKGIRERGTGELLSSLLSGPQRAALQKLAPGHLTLPGGRGITVHYEADKPPWVESRLQDFFGMRETPKVAGGKIPVVAHLLAPNMRALQVTPDLKGFWERTYPDLRREFSRKYPRHSWPEDPLTASPPAPRAPRKH